MRTAAILLTAFPALVVTACADGPSSDPLGPADDLRASSHAGGNFGADLVGWWRFDDSGASPVVIDDSGLGNHGLLVGEAEYTSDAVKGMAVDVTGPSGHVSVGHDPSLEPVTGTVQVWVKLPALKDADVVSKSTLCMVRSEDCTVPIGRSVIGLRVHEDGGVSAFIANDDPTLPGPWTFAATGPGAIGAGAWHHLAMRWDGSDLALFVDGEARAASPYDPVPGTGLSYFDGSPLRLAAATSWGEGHPGDRQLIGQIDDVRFYARARPDVEIRTDYLTGGHKPAKP